MDLPNWVGASGDGRFESRVIPLLVALQHDPGSSDDIRICDFCDHTHEWGVHVTTFARAAPLTDEQVAATRLSHSHADCWLPTERVLIECFDQLCRDALIAERTYERFQALWSLEQQLEILALCGNYHLVSFVANTSRIDNEPTGAQFPEPANHTHRLHMP